MREIRWVISFSLALAIHVALMAGFFLWHTGFNRPIIYSPSFTVSLYSQVPREHKAARPQVIKKGKHRVISKLPPKPARVAPPTPATKEKKVWKVKKKKKKKVSTPRKKPSRKRTGKKTGAVKKRRTSSRVSKAREKALLARALARVSKEVSLGGGISREAVELKYKGYYDEIWRRVKASWILPEEVIASGEDFMAVVVVRIGRNGELLEMKLEKSSGNKIFDQSCLRAVKKAAPFPPLPGDYPQKYMELGLRFRPWE